MMQIPPFCYDLISSSLGPIGMISHPEGLSSFHGCNSKLNLLEIHCNAGLVQQRSPQRFELGSWRLDGLFFQIGNACGKNLLPVVIPRRRAVHEDGPRRVCRRTLDQEKIVGNQSRSV